MRQVFPDLPEWSFEVEEVSAGVYEVTGVDRFGHRVQSKGTDPDALLDEARKWAAKVERELT
jgi:hypothetical protein